MKITETILAQLTDTDILLESVNQAIANVDPHYTDEIEAYAKGVQALLQAAPAGETYLQAKQEEFASDIRFAMWQGFQWELNCQRDPIYKLLAQLDFEELCQESKMHTLPAAQKAQRAARTFTQSLPADKQQLLDPIIEHFAYLETHGYKLAYSAGVKLADRLLKSIVPGYVSDLRLLCATANLQGLYEAEEIERC